jgi:hypothetical protein
MRFLYSLLFISFSGAFIFKTKPTGKRPVWGFYAHEKINYFAAFLLPPELIDLYKKNINYIKEHAVDPDKRRYAIPDEAPKHYIDLDVYGKYPFDTLPRKWQDAVNSFTADSLAKHGTLPWWIQYMQEKLTQAFKQKDKTAILKISAEIGHYIGDLHVPLHTCSNYNGHKTNQVGIHGFWESRVPELLSEKEWDFVWNKADYIENIETFVWDRALESSLASDSVLLFEAALNNKTKPDKKYGFENRNGMVVKQYSAKYTKTYDKMLNGMVERRFKQSVYAVASFWYTAWLNAGQPEVHSLIEKGNAIIENKEMDTLNRLWKEGKVKGRICD